MADRSWEDLIPFYIAGTLSEAETRELESHLKSSAEARQALAEWQVIGEIVYAETGMWSRGLPPLSSKVRDSMRQEPVAPPTQKSLNVVQFPQERTRSHTAERQPGGLRIPVTLVASILIVFLIGGVILFANRNLDDSENIDSAAQAELTESVVFETNTPLPSNTAPATEVDDLGILPAATIRPTNTLLPPPSVATIEATTTAPSGVCIARPAENEAVNIYAGVGMFDQVTGQIEPDTHKRVSVYDPGGWYEVFELGTGLLGWVQSDDVSLSGPCSDLLFPTPTITSIPPTLTPLVATCNFTSEPRTPLYESPSETAGVLLAIDDLADVTPLGWDGADWYQVRYVRQGTTWVGWLSTDDITVSGRCDLLPVVEPYSATATPIISP
jgi:negative regulator of sigma E activity